MRTANFIVLMKIRILQFESAKWKVEGKGMDKKKESADFLESIWDFFSSIRLTVVMLLLLAGTSVIGTVIPQNNERAILHFRENYELVYSVFVALNIFDMYHSWWFRLLLLVLGVNITVCSIHRLSATWKIVFAKNPKFNASQFLNRSSKTEFTVHSHPDSLREKFEKYVSKKFGYSKTEKTENGFRIFAESGRWTRLGVYIVHASVVMLLVGGLVGSIFGFEGFVSIAEGESSHHITDNSRNKYKLGFDIRCDDFNVTFYPSGQPREFRSRLTILEDEKPVLTKDIIVNDPLSYKGWRIYQSSYGEVPSDSENITLDFTSLETGMSYTIKTAIGQPFDLREGLGTFVIKEYRKSHVFRGMQDIGENLLGIWTPANGEPKEVVISLRFPNFDKMRGGEFVVRFVAEERYFTGLQLTNDPGVGTVYMGFAVMIIGFFITFFMSHRRLCVDVSKTGEKTDVIVSGMSDRNKMTMNLMAESIAKHLGDSMEKPG